MSNTAIISVLEQQKEEAKKLLSGNYIPREKGQFINKHLKSDLIKVVTGPRRAGKSVFALHIIKNENFAYVNFDDENLVNIGTDDLLKGIFEIYKNPRFLLFDEIQNLPRWEFFVNKLHRRGYNLILTGSNAKMLSRELSTALTGRHIPIEIFPFNWKEFFSAKEVHSDNSNTLLPEYQGTLLNTLNDFLYTGGYPEVVVKGYEIKSYLSPLFDAIILKDIVRRYNIRFPRQLYNLALYFVNTFSSEFSYTAVKNALEFNSVHTVQNYLNYLEEPYLFFYLKRFSFKSKEILRSPMKNYVCDNGLINSTATQSSFNLGRLFENMVVCEMIKSGYSINDNIFLYKTRNQKEVDLVIKEGLRVTKLIQVCYKLNDVKTEDREIKALWEAGEELNCNDLFVLTWDLEKIIKKNGKKIQFIPFVKWFI